MLQWALAKLAARAGELAGVRLHIWMAVRALEHHQGCFGVIWRVPTSLPGCSGTERVLSKSGAASEPVTAASPRGSGLVCGDAALRWRLVILSA